MIRSKADLTYYIERDKERNIGDIGFLSFWIKRIYKTDGMIAYLYLVSLRKYEYALKLKTHHRAEELMNYTKGSRCTFPDFKCTAPCGFALGINETREI